MQKPQEKQLFEVLLSVVRWVASTSTCETQAPCRKCREQRPRYQGDEIPIWCALGKNGTAKVLIINKHSGDSGVSEYLSCDERALLPEARRRSQSLTALLLHLPPVIPNATEGSRSSSLHNISTHEGIQISIARRLGKSLNGCKCRWLNRETDILFF